MSKIPVAKPKEQTQKKAPPPEPKVPKPETQKLAIAKKEIEPAKQAAQKPIKLPQEVKIVETPQAEYSIEIFSTADKEEAAYWLDQLQRRGINAFKKIQRIRNVDYYKIRIGSYKTAEEAKAVARALGFKNVWIDRVK
jgi:septal ring-binding cell division protein DamX